MALTWGSKIPCVCQVDCSEHCAHFHSVANRQTRGQREGSELKALAAQGLALDSQHLHDGSLLSNSSLRGSDALLGPVWAPDTHGTQTCRQVDTHHTQDIFKPFSFFFVPVGNLDIPPKESCSQWILNTRPQTTRNTRRPQGQKGTTPANTQSPTL